MEKQISWWSCWEDKMGGRRAQSILDRWGSVCALVEVMFGVNLVAFATEKDHVLQAGRFYAPEK